MVNIFTDGGARGNPGPSAVGIVVLENENKIASFGKKIGNTTNNSAEYQAVIFALDWLLENKEKLSGHSILFFLDSQLVYSQITGLYKIKDSKLRELLFKVREKEGELGIPVSYNLIPREKNKEADKLVNLALDNKI